MPKKCIKCGEQVWGKGYCKNHQYLRTDKKPKPIAKLSKKQGVLNAEYNVEAKQFKLDNPWCIFPGCNKPTADVHHSRGRGKYLMDKTTWKPLCRACHQYCEENVWEAIELGLTASRLT